jgi:thioredoxin-like negative regulator of GroEL
MTLIGGGSRGGSSGGPQGAGPLDSETVPYVTERDFEREVLSSQVPVLIEFVAARSEPCRQIAQEVEAFAKEMHGKLKVVKVDVDKSPTIAKQLRLQSVPTFMLFAEQKLADAHVGAMGRKELRAMVEPFLPRQEGALKPAELAQLIKQGGVVVPVDTRDAGAFARAHLPGAKHMPLEEITTRLAELYMLAGQPVLYCRSGDKTKELAAVLAEQGVPAAFLEGGLLAWEADGLAIER